VIYENISPQRLAAIEARVQQELGISISGNEGTATKNGITIAWVYDPSGQTLTVGDTHKPWYVPESRIDEELTKLVNATEPPRKTQ
jgi:hypothetical protein